MSRSNLYLSKIKLEKKIIKTSFGSDLKNKELFYLCKRLSFVNRQINVILQKSQNEFKYK
jgi:hypothetical protein